MHSYLSLYINIVRVFKAPGSYNLFLKTLKAEADAFTTAAYCGSHSNKYRTS